MTNFGMTDYVEGTKNVPSVFKGPKKRKEYTRRGPEQVPERIELITDISQVIMLADLGLCVWFKPWSRKVPAAFFQCWQARVLHNSIRHYNMYAIKK